MGFASQRHEHPGKGEKGHQREGAAGSNTSDIDVTLSVEYPARASGSLTIYAAYMRDRPLGRAGSWLLADLQARFS